MQPGSIPHGFGTVRQRTVSATVVVIVTLVPLVLGTWAWFVLIFAVLLQGARELARGFSRVTREPIQPLSIVLSASILLITVQLFDSSAVMLIAVISASLTPIAWYACTADHRDGLQRGVLASFGGFYLGAPLCAAILLRSIEGIGHAAWLQRLAALLGTERTALGLAWLAWALSVTWLTDTFAYLAGSRYGHRKLAPRLSPGKTWEGAVAGFLTGLLVGMLGAWLFGVPLSPWVGGLAGAALGVLAELGDLAESFLKRGLGLKDFGRSIPGHGGVLDRIDALLVTIPATLLLATLLVGGTR